MLRFLVWCLCAWIVICGGILLFMRLTCGSFDMRMFPIVALLSAFPAVMVAGTESQGPRNGRGL